ncbi:glycosyltransferase [Flavobacterium sp. TAB 87]|uniref:glycosyltransferase n=1 Tax=Flavobacterium sp. TAB 87 TaxID=1729581 RepID=UPI001E5E9C97|nr:glycosyltransferase [Flavobacterium sp. TAB 87]
MKVLFIEEPISYSDEEENLGNLLIITESLHVLQPKVRNIEEIEKVIPNYVKNQNVSIGWFYSASFTPLLNSLNFGIVIYDCMDELSLFKDASHELLNQEKKLMAVADIVFTGGKSLYDAKKEYHSNVYCFPSSVDEPHFAQALKDIELPSDIADIQTPVAGYIGVIDERLDLSLLHDTAKLLPEVSFIMVGPLAKISEDDLPKLKNIIYLGMRSYEQLPAYLKAFDVAIMPFALNASTKYISPTKTLEYIAAGAPIISTKIKDVVSDYSSCVTLVETSEEFVHAIATVLNLTDPTALQMEYQEILKKTSWDATVNRMQSIIETYAV